MNSNKYYQIFTSFKGKFQDKMFFKQTVTIIFLKTSQYKLEGYFLDTILNLMIIVQD